MFAVFFKPQTRDFHQTKSSSRALAECEQSEQFRHLKRLAVLREAERVKGEALTRFFGYFFDARQKSNTRQGRRSVAAKRTDKSKFEQKSRRFATKTAFFLFIKSS